MVTTSNYNALANSCTHHLITAHTKSFRFVFISRFMLTDPNNVLCLCPSRLAIVSQLTHCSNCRLRVRVTLRLRFIASLPWRQAARGSWPEIFFWQLNPCRHSPHVTSSLTRGWVCLLWIGFASPLWSVRIAHIARYWKFFLVHYMQILCQYSLWKADHV
jgi:hypothetical protein